MFVSTSIGANFYHESHSDPPTVVIFSSVLFICIMVTVPSHDWTSLGGLIGTGALPGALLVRHSFSVDLSDRIFRALIPVAGCAPRRGGQPCCC